MSWSPNGQFLASGSFDATVAIYNFNAGKFDLVSKLEGHENEVFAENFSEFFPNFTFSH